jgi:hypothetical protein
MPSIAPQTSLQPTGLSGDRETATAQAVAECLTRKGISRSSLIVRFHLFIWMH